MFAVDVWCCVVFTVVLTCGCYDCVVPESEGEDAVAVVIHSALVWLGVNVLLL